MKYFESKCSPVAFFNKSGRPKFFWKSTSLHFISNLLSDKNGGRSFHVLRDQMTHVYRIHKDHSNTQKFQQTKNANSRKQFYFHHQYPFDKGWRTHGFSRHCCHREKGLEIWISCNRLHITRSLGGNDGHQHHPKSWEVVFIILIPLYPQRPSCWACSSFSEAI